MVCASIRHRSVAGRPGLSHSLQSCVQQVAAGSPCAQQEFSPAVLKLVGDWIVGH